MKKILLAALFTLLMIWNYWFAVCVQWSWVCNDTFDSDYIPSDEEIEMLVNLWVINATKSEVEIYWLEQIKAYFWAFNNSITTQPSVKQANLEWKITREEMAKMISNYAVNVLWIVPDTTKSCYFINSNINPTLVQSVTESCQLWLMWQWIIDFRPKDSVTRAEFWTVLSRALWWNKNEWWAIYYENHLKALKTEWIMNKIDSPMNNEVRWYVMLMLMRSALESDGVQTYNDGNYTEYDDISYVMEMLD